MIVAHHDIVNPNVDNANDNSCSVINAIMTKKLRPEIHVVLLDGEEVGGIGADHLSNKINSGEFGKIDWVLNLELTGIGHHFFIGNYPGKLSEHISNIFDCPIINTPFNDSVIFRKNNIDSCVINTLPISDSGTVKWKNNIYLDISILYNCHTEKDTVDKIDIDCMKIFVENVLLKIID
jgi:hypothetical protein